MNRNIAQSELDEALREVSQTASPVGGESLEPQASPRTGRRESGVPCPECGFNMAAECGCWLCHYCGCSFCG